jgi:hypothetical protein
MSVTVAERSTAWTAFARSEADIVGSNTTQGMDVWFVLSCVQVETFRRADHSSKGSYRL